VKPTFAFAVSTASGGGPPTTRTSSPPVPFVSSWGSPCSNELSNRAEAAKAAPVTRMEDTASASPDFFQTCIDPVTLVPFDYGSGI